MEKDEREIVAVKRKRESKNIPRVQNREVGCRRSGGDERARGKLPLRH